MDAIFGAFAGVRLAVFGDLLVEAQWQIDDSVEPGRDHGVRAVQAQRYGLGAASRVAGMAAGLGLAGVELVGAVGADAFGGVFVGLAEQSGIDTRGVLQLPGWQTRVSANPITDVESANGVTVDQRFEFGIGNQLDPDAITALIGALEGAAARCAAVLIHQQVDVALTDGTLVARINDVIARFPATRFLVAAQCGCDRYVGAAVALDSQEAMAVARKGEADAAAVARRIAATNGKPVFLTRGAHGLSVIEADHSTEIPGIQIIGATSAVGAGDTVLAVLASVLAVSGTPSEAGRLANLASAVTVRKTNTSSTVGVDEIRALEHTVDYIFRPELAEDPSRANFHVHGDRRSEIEIIEQPKSGLSIAHAIFDHDGTISTLRQGWERIMEPMMVHAVLGAQQGKVTGEVYQNVVGTVRRLIDQTTGIQTLAQMKALANLVRQFGFVPEAEILDEAGYKRIYNDELIAQVAGRLAKFRAGELSSADFQVTGALRLLKHLRAHGVRLYLASGTDEVDVKAEAAALGYAELFDGGIFGAVGNLAKEAKREVIERILRDNGISGERLMVVGDGPVEMREGLRRGALCIGVASDEPRRYGLDPAKRSRLIRAGAHLVVPDFTQLPQLLPLINLA